MLCILYPPVVDTLLFRIKIYANFDGAYWYFAFVYGQASPVKIRHWLGGPPPNSGSSSNIIPRKYYGDGYYFVKVLPRDHYRYDGELDL